MDRHLTVLTESEDRLVPVVDSYEASDAVADWKLRGN